MKNFILVLFLCLLVGCGNDSTTGPTTEPEYVQGDVNCDGYVDALDMEIVSLAFGSREMDTHWNPLADIDGSGRVDAADINIVVSQM